MLHSILKQTVDVTFNKVTVDSDSSTNDTCIMLASGAAGADAAPIEEGSDAYNELLYAVHEVCETLARTIASDGEGASRLVTVNVTGAATDEDADTAARPWPTRRWSRPPSPAMTATGAASPWHWVSAASPLTKRMSQSISWACPYAAEALPLRLMRTRRCDASRRPRS